MNRRVEPPDSLDLFPTPPWATRALLRYLIACSGVVWEPAAGLGHMSEVLKEFDFDRVVATDVFPYGEHLDGVGSYVGQGLDVAPAPAGGYDWMITNPPYTLASEFVLRGLKEARRGVAVLCRSNWAEGETRFRELFEPLPPTLISQFAERVPMVKGRWDPDASSATAYSWFVWDKHCDEDRTEFRFIPPICRRALERPDDRRRFGPPASAGSLL
ncbi:MAG: class I SAM-dependent methyltransferase [Desulfurellales bacterium]|nr:MAG: class I SAM-dependent methyltransferase [Desulfurellales bacterium]